MARQIIVSFEVTLICSQVTAKLWQQ